MADRDRKEDNTLDSPLGIAGSPVTPDAPEHLKAQDDEASIRRRRARAGLGPDADDRTTDGMGDLQPDHKGATGIDMGAAGDDTNISDRGTK
jgi:hypothetical protein